ncbi:biotin/lipoyl-binding protein [bacterium]|nr:biotin/lipoyl-binding protein [bacterium]
MKITVKIENQEFLVEVEDLSSRPVIATIEGESFEVWPEETASETVTAAPVAAPKPAAAPARPAAAAAVTVADASKAVTAPLPGTIVAISVKEGAAVKFGQELLVLEAMKMKNSIRASRDGKVKAILVNVGDQVRHGQALVEYAD